MNLALQTRRAVITLSLMALAMACIAAKTMTRHDTLSAATPVRVESTGAQTVQVSAISDAVRCEAKIISI